MNATLSTDDVEAIRDTVNNRKRSPESDGIAVDRLRSIVERIERLSEERKALGEDIGPIPEGLYPGDYLKPVGEDLRREHGATLTAKGPSTLLPLADVPTNAAGAATRSLDRLIAGAIHCWS